MSRSLSDAEVAALFDILSHYDTYAEIRDFRNPESLDHYGPPFTSEKEVPSTSPALQSLVSRFLLTLPGFNNFSSEFWQTQIRTIVRNFESAELSESYDKGSIGTRKTISTALSALIEYPVRGTHGGFAMIQETSSDYDLHSAEDLSRAFRDFLNQAIYGDILEEMNKKGAETDSLEDHPPLTQALHEFLLVNIASLMHYTLILTPKGQYLVKLMDNINRLIPYVLVRQTLKIGNVASMINGLVKIGLVKMSVASLTNWIGLTQTEDEGMNLIQQIISTVLNWDIRDLESRATKIEKDKHGLSKQQIQAIKDYIAKPREEHERIRKQSQQEYISIVMAIFNDASSPTANADVSSPASTSSYWTASSVTPTSPKSPVNLTANLNDALHSAALEYLAVQLSIRDRREIIRVLCRSIPDHFTTATRSGVAAYEPIIRELHNAVDLSDALYDFEIFFKDLLKLAKVQATASSSSWWPSGGDSKSATSHTANVPTVGDFVQLLKKHQYSLHKFLHQISKNGPEIASWFVNWGRATAAQFRRDTASSEENSSAGIQTAAGDLTEPLNDLFDDLPEEKQKEIREVLAMHTKYLDEIHAASNQRLAAVLATPASKNPAILKIVAGSISRPSSRHSSRPGSRADSRATSRNASPAAGLRSGYTAPTSNPDASPPRSSSLNPNTHPAPTSVNIDAAKAPNLPSKQGLPSPLISSDPGPGAFLARWQDLLESTPITPLTPKGDIQQASSKEVIQNSSTDVDGSKTAEFPAGKGGAEQISPAQSGHKHHKKPDVKLVMDTLGKAFRKMLAKRSLNW